MYSEDDVKAESPIECAPIAAPDLFADRGRAELFKEAEWQYATKGKTKRELKLVERD
jgi:hypothetical protein